MILLSTVAVLAQASTKLPDGVDLPINGGVLSLRVMNPSVVRVHFGKSAPRASDSSLTVLAKPKPTPWTWSESAGSYLLKTSALTVTVDRKTGAVKFADAKSKTFLAERPGRKLTPTTVAGKPTLEAVQPFELAKGEAIYGLGQHQSGVFNYVGSPVHLQQENKEIAIPVLTSSRGYGILWDNAAVTDVDVAGGKDTLVPSSWLSDETGQAGGLTAEYFIGRNFEKSALKRRDSQIDFNWTATPPPGLPHDDYSIRWTGSLVVPKSGEYTFAASGDDGIRLFIDDKLVAQDWNSRALFTATGKVRLEAGKRYKVRFEFYQDKNDAIVRWSYRTPPATPTVTWTSEAAKAIDYYFIAGPDLDDVVARYRDLTGAAPMFARSAWGLWQSRERYQSQAELIDVADRYQKAKIPLDNMIQDWQYWPSNSWGSHDWDPVRFPDPTGLMSELHRRKLHAILSVWPKFDVGLVTTTELEKAGAMLPKVIPYVFPPGKGMWYDPYGKVGRDLYWSQIAKRITVHGWDGYWLDASEPELGGRWGELRELPTAMGPGFEVFNAYPLLHTKAVYEGARKTVPEKRSLILTRSGYTGQQRNGAISWSGDIDASWPVYTAQIPAGMNFVLSGIPYWNTDTGGFFANQPVTSPEYQDLFSRWFQFSTFCPMLRIHGSGTAKEIWRWTGETRTTLERFDRLRYRLLPYIYTASADVTQQGASMMRPLPLDFREDPKVASIADEFLFGQSLLVAPVITPKATTRSVYLPKGTDWVDFWTGQQFKGGTSPVSDAVGKLPIFARVGSILTLGPNVQNASEADDPIEIRIYAGANGTASLYEDAGDGYQYEKGQYARIPFAWNDRTKTLTVGERKGQFPGMRTERNFRVVLVRPGRGVTEAVAETVDQTLRYDGKRLLVKL